MKRVIQIIFTALIVTTSVFAEKYNGGDGTEANPYQIHTAQQLQQIGISFDDRDKHFILTADIDISMYDGKEGRPYFNSIGVHQTDGFPGVFDGDGHTISGFTYDFMFQERKGLFMTVLEQGVVKNLKLDDVNIKAYSFIGGIAAINRGTITDCHVKGYIESTHSDAYVGLLVAENTGTINNCTSSGTCIGGNTGGLIGFNDNYNSGNGGVINCSSTANVNSNFNGGGLIGINRVGLVSSCFATGSTNSYYTAGGLIGENSHGSISSCFATGSVSGNRFVGGLFGESYYQGESIPVTNCYAIGDVSSTSLSQESAVGGLVGRAVGRYINCYATGKLSGSENVLIGGLIGSDSFYYNQDLIFENCFWDVETSGVTEPIFGKSQAGATGLNTDDMKFLATFVSAGWDFVTETANGTEDIWDICDGAMYPRLARSLQGSACDEIYIFEGSGTVEDPYQISNVEQLLTIGQYHQLWDKHFILTDGIYFGLYNEENDFPNFTPIGTSEVPFTGSFDGNGTVVKQLYFSSENVNNVGMFGCIGQVGAVRNLAVYHAEINVSGGINIGILAGINQGTIENCNVRGSVTGNYATGSIAGLNQQNATISGCDSFGEVTGTFSLTGGIAGGNYGKIENSRTTAFITGGTKVGAIAGYNSSGTIENCYSHAHPQGTAEVGGLAGRNYKGQIKNCYSTGTPKGDSYVGALIGKEINGLGVFTGCFYDITVNPDLSGTGSSATDPQGITGETTANLMLAATYAGWDTTTPIWAIRDNIDYPRFARQLLPFDIAGSWDIDLADLKVLASNWLKDGFTPQNGYANGDFDGSGKVDLADLSKLSSIWLGESLYHKLWCRSNLKGLLYGMMIYKSDNYEYPPDLNILLELEGYSTGLYTCSATHDHYPETSYAYRGAGLSGIIPSYMVLIYDKAGNHDGGRNVGFAEGYVAWMTEEDFQAAIEKDNQWRATRPDLDEIPIE